MTLQRCLVLIKKYSTVPTQTSGNAGCSFFPIKGFSRGRVTFRGELPVCFQSAFPLPFASAQAARRSGGFFLAMLMIVHWKLNCRDKLIAQRQGVSNDSSSLLIGLCLNQQLRRGFLFFLTLCGSLALFLHLRDCHLCAKDISFMLLCVAYCLKVA